jgi:type I restriction enzyme S subunit
MREKTIVPAIRFAGFTDAWEQCKVSDVTNRFDNLRIPVAANLRVPGTTPYYGANGIQDYVDGFTHDGEFVLVAEDGANDLKNYPVRCVNGRIWVNNHAHVLQGKPEMADNKFLAYSISQADIESLLVGGGRAKLNAEIMMGIEFHIPSLDEQRIIGKYLTHLDHLITLHQRKYSRLYNIKKSMLERMFPKEGASVPEIRFAGFTDAWEQRKLEEMSYSFEYGLNAAATTYDGENRYIRITDIDDETRLFSTTDLTSPDIDLKSADNYRLRESDIVFARTGASVGKTYIYKPFDGIMYYAGFLIRARIRPEYSANFVFQNTLTEQYRNFVAITSQRSGQPGINAQEYSTFEFFVPGYKEQEQIGAFFRHLDHLITLHQRKLERLQNIKKSCLEKMFV